MKELLLVFFLIFLFPSISLADQTMVQIWNKSPKLEKKAFTTGYVHGRIASDSRWYNIVCEDHKPENKDLCRRIALEFSPEETSDMTIAEIDISVFDYVNAVFSREKYQHIDFYKVLDIAYIATIYRTKESQFWERIEKLGQSSETQE